MDAKKCDRCGKYYDRNTANRKYKMEKLTSNGYFILDLCEECHSSIVNFMTYAEEDKWIPDEPDGNYIANYVAPGVKTIL